MIGTSEILIGPHSSFVNFMNGIGEKIILRHIFIVLQNRQCMFVDMSMNLTFGLDNDFFKGIQNPECRFQESMV